MSFTVEKESSFLTFLSSNLRNYQDILQVITIRVITNSKELKEINWVMKSLPKNTTLEVSFDCKFYDYPSKERVIRAVPDITTEKTIFKDPRQLYYLNFYINQIGKNIEAEAKGTPSLDSPFPSVKLNVSFYAQ